MMRLLDGRTMATEQEAGNKGANLLQMNALGLPIPQGVILPAAMVDGILTHNAVPDAILDGVFNALPETPMRLFSVRSSPSVSMPGLMDTLLNVGLTMDSMPLAAEKMGEQGAWITRFNQLACWARVVGNQRSFGRMQRDPWEALVDATLEQCGFSHPDELPLAVWQELTRTITAAMASTPLPTDSREQLREGILAVARSSRAPKVQQWKDLQHHHGPLGCAVVVQAMVCGHANAESGAGVALSRHTNHGTGALSGEFLHRAQGDALMGGLKTPTALTGRSSFGVTLEMAAPRMLEQLSGHVRTLERVWKMPVEVEFTVENGKLWLLQARRAGLSPKAAVKAAHDLAQEHIVTRAEALALLDPALLWRVVHAVVAPEAVRDVLARGVPASVGACQGRAVFTADDALEVHRQGQAAILVRMETRADDVPGLQVCAGMVTARGGTTSHAAVVARGTGVACVVGCHQLRVDAPARRAVNTDGRILNAMDVITVDGNSGDVLMGAPTLTFHAVTAELTELLQWARALATLQVGARAGSSVEEALASGGGSQEADRSLPTAPWQPMPAPQPRLCLLVEDGADPAAVEETIRTLHHRGTQVWLDGPASLHPALLQRFARAGLHGVRTGWRDVPGAWLAAALAAQETP